MYPSAKRNKRLVRLSYLSLALLFTAVYVLTEVFFILANYASYCVQLPYQVLFKNKNRMKGIVVCFLWVVGGVPYSLFVFFTNDVPLFLRSLYHEYNVKDKFDIITVEEVKIIHRAIQAFKEAGQL